MCLGVPGKVLSISDDGMSAQVDFFGVQKELRLDIVDEPVTVGDYVLNHVGFAIRRIPPEEVGETLALFDQILKEAAAGDLMAEDVRGEIAAGQGPAAGPRGGEDLTSTSSSSATRPGPRADRGAAAGGRGDRARAVSVMHVCGSHEQAIARFGLRAAFPRNLDVIMGPGCPVCVTDTPGGGRGGGAGRARASGSAPTATCCGCPGRSKSLADAQVDGGNVEVVYSVSQAVEMARARPAEQVVFFATGFETTAVATAAVILAGVPDNFSVLSSHKYVPAAMDLVAGIEETSIEGFIAAGHAATITGWGIFEPFAARTRIAGGGGRLRAARRARRGPGAGAARPREAAPRW